MPAPITRYFLDEPKLRSVAFRYGYLAFLLGLAVLAAVSASHLSPTARGRYFGLIIPPTLLFSHLAFQFRWPVPVKVGLRIVTIIACGALLVYTLMVAFH